MVFDDGACKFNFYAEIELGWRKNLVFMLNIFPHCNSSQLEIYI